MTCFDYEVEELDMCDGWNLSAEGATAVIREDADSDKVRHPADWPDRVYGQRQFASWTW